MIRIASRFPALAFALALAAAPLAAQPYPDRPADGIADLAGVLTSADADAVRSAIHRMRADPGVEVHVLTVPRVPADPEAFATAVYNHWELGRGYRNDGVLVMVSVDDRFTRIEVGDGAPAGTEARMREIVDGVMVPRFRQGEMSGGLREGVLAVAGAFGAPAPAAPLPAAAPAPQPVPYTLPERYDNPDDELNLSAGALMMILLLGAGAAGAGAYLYQKSQKQKCARCGGRLVRVEGQARDAHLDQGQRMEEALGSVRHELWRCAGCGESVARADPRLTEHDRCGECGYRTVATTRTVVQKPTYESAGSERVETKCAHCGWSQVDVVPIARKVRTERPVRHPLDDELAESARSARDDRDTSDDSGGGHSSGRGASGRW